MFDSKNFTDYDREFTSKVYEQYRGMVKASHKNTGPVITHFSMRDMLSDEFLGDTRKDIRPNLFLTISAGDTLRLHFSMATCDGKYLTIDESLSTDKKFELTPITPTLTETALLDFIHSTLIEADALAEQVAEDIARDLGKENTKH